jgi:hypothetical protein
MENKNDTKLDLSYTKHIKFKVNKKTGDLYTDDLTPEQYKLFDKEWQ